MAGLLSGAAILQYLCPMQRTIAIALVAILCIVSFPASLASQTAAPSASETLVIGGGCFWCLEGAFEIVPGVLDVVSGYAAGSLAKPSYEEVCTGTTGHAEVVRISFDPTRVGLSALFDLFFTIHDPTTRDRQGADVGPQYRSIILYATDAQRRAAVAAIAKIQAGLAAPVVTELKPLKVFWMAEEYHQDYYKKHPDYGYCRLVVAPKVGKSEEWVKRSGLIKP